MIKYTSTRQISIEEFKTPFARGLDKNNRWVHLAQKIPWDEFARIYGKALCKGFGRPSVNARVVIGAMIIKHKKCLPDEATIEEIQENAYLQYFLGYEEFRHDQAFDPSLFVTIRKRIGQEAFEEMKSLKAEHRRRKEEGRLRNRIEGKFGEGKRKYDLDCIMAKTMHTSESWIAAIFFVMNIAHWMRVDFFALVWNWLKNASQRFLFDVKEQTVFRTVYIKRYNSKFYFFRKPYIILIHMVVFQKHQIKLKTVFPNNKIMQS